MRPLTPMELSDHPHLAPYLTDRASRSCDDSLLDMLMWRRWFDKAWTVVGDSLVVRMVGYDRQPCYMVPLGGAPASRSEALRAIVRDSRASGVPLRFMAALAEDVAWLQAEGLGVRTETDEAWWDYLYDAAELTALEGRAYRTPRGHINKFERDFFMATFEPVTAQNLPAVTEFLAHIRETAPKEAPILDEEAVRIREVLAHREALQPLTGVLAVGDRVVGLTLGEVIGETLFTHVEKARTDIPGAYAVLTQRFNAAVLAQYPNLRWINREEDMGDEGLRQAKLAYHPAERLQKFLVTVTDLPTP